MFRKLITTTFAAFLLLGLSSAANAQTDFDTETFQVVIPAGLSIQAPTPLVSQVHDETNNNQVFPSQVWLVTANNAIGATVVFTTDQAFTHTGDNTYKRNASVNLSVATGSAWTVGNASAVTDYAGPGGEVVTVDASSSTAGGATFNVDVTFVEETFTDLASGNYEMTVTGTLTAK